MVGAFAVVTSTVRDRGRAPRRCRGRRGESGLCGRVRENDVHGPGHLLTRGERRDATWLYARADLHYAGWASGLASTAAARRAGSTFR